MPWQTAQKEFNNLTATLESERYRAEGLEEQINDLTELHQVNRANKIIFFFSAYLINILMIFFRLLNFRYLKLFLMITERN